MIINAKRKLSTLGGKLIFFYLPASTYFRSIVFETSLLSVFDSILRSKAMSKQLQTKKLGFNNFWAIPTCTHIKEKQQLILQGNDEFWMMNYELWMIEHWCKMFYWFKKHFLFYSLCLMKTHLSACLLSGYWGVRFVVSITFC